MAVSPAPETSKMAWARVGVWRGAASPSNSSMPCSPRSVSAGGQGQSEDGNGGIAGAGDVEDGLGAGGRVARRGIAFKQQHAVLAERDEQATGVPQLAQTAAGFEQGMVFKHGRDGFAGRKAGGEKGFGAVGLDGGGAAPGKRSMGIDRKSTRLNSSHLG